MKILASIIIRTYNEEKKIGKCLSAVLKQKIRQKFEIIIVDSESTDSTLEIIKEIAKKFPVKIIGIRKKDFSYGRALNVGCATAKGKYLISLSAHAIPLNKNWLKNLIQNFKYSKIAGVYGKQVPAENCNPLTKRQMLAHWKDDKKIQSKDSFFSNANSAIRKDIWKENKFNESLMASEDHEWAKRVQEK